MGSGILEGKNKQQKETILFLLKTATGVKKTREISGDQPPPPSVFQVS